MDLATLSPEDRILVANTIRVLSAEAVEKANSGHPGMPMGMAEIATVLWLKYLSFNPTQAQWLNRDRFVLSNGHGSMLLYSMLHLCGYQVTLSDLESFRQWGSKTPGHPESHMTPGVEATTGPLGQGISNAVGMALGQKMLASRYFAGSPDLLNHRVYVFAGDGCLMEGVSSESGSLAGHLGLGNLIVVYDDNHISIAGDTELAFTEDVIKRYEAYGWHTERVDGHDINAVDGAIQRAVAETQRPSLIAARTQIGKGSPNKANSEHVHGSPLGKDELALTKRALGWPEDKSFFVPPRVKEIFAARVEEVKNTFGEWQERFRKWNAAQPDLALRLGAQLERRLPQDLREKLVRSLPYPPQAAATRKISGDVIQVISKEVDAFVGGSADLEPSTFTLIKGSSDITREDFSGKNIRFGVREHAMGSIMNGLSYYGGYIPYGSTFLVFSDYMRPPIRLAALSHLQAIYVFTHDSIFLGEDGPTHQAIEHIPALRVIPNLYVFRPADGVETAVSYAYALSRKDGPSAFALSRQNLDPIERPKDFDLDSIERGGYSIFESSGGKGGASICFIATGSEVSLALAVAKQIRDRVAEVRVVSMPCFELFKSQEQGYRESLIPRSWKKVVVEAAAPWGWLEGIGGGADDTLVYGIDHFGASAPAKVLGEKFGFVPEALLQAVTKRFSI